MALFSLTVNAAKVASTLSDYPAYVDLSELPAAFWSVVSASGGDIRVYSDEAKTTELAREVVSCDTGTDTGEVHVKIPSLTTSTVIYFTVDGTSSEPAAGSTYGSQAVWSDYAAVYHMKDATTSTLADSTVGGRTATKTSADNPLEATGQIEKGQTISSDRADTASVPMTATDNFTIQAWLNPTATGNYYSIVHNGANSDGYALAMNNSNWAMLIAGIAWNEMNLAVTTGSWQMVHGVRTSGTSYTYKNSTKSTAGVTTAPNTPTTLLRMGVATFNTAYAGGMDEVRLRASVLSDNWITTEYNNQSDVASFWTIAEVSTYNPAIARRRVM